MNSSQVIMSLFFYQKEGLDIEGKKKFDKEYRTENPTEVLYLRECGIPYTFVKKDEHGITVYKYKKNYRLFDTLKNFYKNF